MRIPWPAKLIYVEWDDADSISRWMDPKDVDRYLSHITTIRQAGFVLTETKQHLVMAGSLYPGDEFNGELMGDLIRIPKPWIHKRVTLMTLTEQGAIKRLGGQ